MKGEATAGCQQPLQPEPCPSSQPFSYLVSALTSPPPGSSLPDLQTGSCTQLCTPSAPPPNLAPPPPTIPSHSCVGTHSVLPRVRRRGSLSGSLLGPQGHSAQSQVPIRTEFSSNESPSLLPCWIPPFYSLLTSHSYLGSVINTPDPIPKPSLYFLLSTVPSSRKPSLISLLSLPDPTPGSRVRLMPQPGPSSPSPTAPSHFLKSCQPVISFRMVSQLALVLQEKLEMFS